LEQVVLVVEAEAVLVVLQVEIMELLEQKTLAVVAEVLDLKELAEEWLAEKELLLCVT
jgi:hypothetical protein